MDVVLGLGASLLAAAVVGWWVTAPLRRGRGAVGEGAAQAELELLEEAKEAKYREIRDAELDHRTGKLGEADWKAIDRQLRAEAVELLDRIERLGS